MQSGYIKLYRKIMDTGIIQNPHALQLFIYFLLNAAYKPVSRDVRGEMIKLEPGQLIIGRKNLAEKLQISEKNVRTAIKYLEKNEIVAIRTAKRYSLVSIINWDTYQAQNIEGGQQNGQEAAMRRPRDGHQTAMRRPRDGHERAKRRPQLKNLRIKESNKEIRKEFNNQNTEQTSLPGVVDNIKKNKKKKTGDTLPEMKEAIEEYTENQELREALLEWLKMRCLIPGKKPTGYAIDLALKKLDKLAVIETEKINIVNQSVVCNWTTFYELKRENSLNLGKSNSKYNPADKTAYVMDQNRQAAQRWLERELKKQGEQNGSSNE